MIDRKGLYSVKGYTPGETHLDLVTERAQKDGLVMRLQESGNTFSRWEVEFPSGFFTVGQVPMLQASFRFCRGVLSQFDCTFDELGFINVATALSGIWGQGSHVWSNDVSACVLENIGQGHCRFSVWHKDTRGDYLSAEWSFRHQVSSARTREIEEDV